MIPALGSNIRVRLLDGREVRYVNLDYAATAPPMADVATVVRAAEPLYGSVHRGSGHTSYISTWLCEQARRLVAAGFGADPAYHQILFDRNSTGAVNKLARILRLKPSDVVLVSEIEHSSNDLPWRKWAEVMRYRTTLDHAVDLESLRRLLLSHGPRVRLVAVTGASNVTGYIPPIHDLARLCHEFGAMIFVDCAQLAPHRRINLAGAGPEDRIDLMVASGHKLGAPYGTGVVVVPRHLLESRDIPADEPGGGTTDILTESAAYWTASPDRFESGSPNLLGIIAFAKALEVLGSVGFENLEEHEKSLWRNACHRLRHIPKVRLYVDERDKLPRTPVISFNIDGLPHGVVASALAFEHGIGVRHGRLCADRLIMRLLGVSDDDQKEVVSKVVCRGLLTDIYGVVRASIGFATTNEDIDRLCEAVNTLACDGPRFRYMPSMDNHPVSGRPASQTGEFWPADASRESLFELIQIPDAFNFLTSPE